MVPAPRVSVVLLTFQQRGYVDEAVASVLGQTYPDVELVAADNASTDGTRERLESYAGRPNVRLLLDWDNTSITKPLNAAIRASTGDLISILYGDDLYLPDKIERQVRLFTDLPESYGVVYSPGYREDVESGRRWLETRPGRSGDLLSDLLTGRASVNPIAPLIRRACFEKHPYREELFLEGEGIFFRFAMTHRFLYDPHPTVVMREHRHNMGKAVARNAETALAVFDLLEHDPLFPPALRPLVARARADTLQRVGWWAVRIAEDPRLAREAFARETAIDPRRALRPRVLAGRLLSALGPARLRAVNRALNSLRRHRVHLDYMADYERWRGSA